MPGPAIGSLGTVVAAIDGDALDEPRAPLKHVKERAFGNGEHCRELVEPPGS